MKTVLFVVAVLAAACGGKKSEPAKPVESKTEMKAEKHESMSPEAMKFHEVLSPRWHAEKGPQRMKDTCAAIADFQTNADALSKAPAPAGADATKWTAGTKDLTDAVSALDVTCKANDATAFEVAFKRVHEGFHGLLENGEHHEEHGGEHAEHKM
jgi:hypothetical protein